MKRTLIFAAAASALAFAASASAQNFVIVNGTVATGDGSDPIEGGMVEVKDGKIAYVGPERAFETTTVYDVAGKWVTPGIFAAATDIGLADVGGVSESNDSSANGSPYNAALDISTAINPSSQHIAVSRAGGVTRATVTGSPGRSIFAGQGATIDLGADGQPITVAKSFQLVALGEAGARLAGGSRVASQAELRNALREAAAFAAGTWEGGEAILTRADAEALVAVTSGKQKLYVHVERAQDIRGALGLKREFPKLDMVLLSVSEGWLVADEIAASGVPVIADPLDDLPSSFEQLAATQSNVGRMFAAGVKVAIGGIDTFNQPRNLTQYAGNLVALQKVPRASGLSWGQAFAAITSVPAEISGMGGKAGVLTAGAFGDVVIWDGDPLELSSEPVTVYIDGVEQPLDNHQTRLRDRYRDLNESDLPKAYDW
ncbi:amidohydrolase family protein [Pontixanthobacter gangjinensis]|uniref:Amidohydrolase family protein n=1 Tax=Pontixanthobacter gangjinensis TaxID=1028742 RepID=A0A6I4SKX5_9SPHN|nr:amidohydrolase family protein [Pontixanthobacter gangjinensis]MXO55816.1 amidohydrolase family protein [Pontixanthobacter gangjinensis]